MYRQGSRVSKHHKLAFVLKGKADFKRELRLFDIRISLQGIKISFRSKLSGKGWRLCSAELKDYCWKVMLAWTSTHRFTERIGHSIRSCGCGVTMVSQRHRVVSLFLASRPSNDVRAAWTLAGALPLELWSEMMWILFSWSKIQRVFWCAQARLTLHLWPWQQNACCKTKKQESSGLQCHRILVVTFQTNVDLTSERLVQVTVSLENVSHRTCLQCTSNGWELGTKSHPSISYTCAEVVWPCEALHDSWWHWRARFIEPLAAWE